MRWHHGCPNPRPAPCGGFIAGMNTVICWGRAAQLVRGAFWGTRVGGRQHPPRCPPRSLLTAADRVVPWEHSPQPSSGQRHSVPLSAWEHT